MQYCAFGEVQLERASTRNIGLGGAFILCRSPLAVGARLIVLLSPLRGGARLELPAQVRWVTPPDAPAEHRGMGVQFVLLTPAQLRDLAEHLNAGEPTG